MTPRLDPSRTTWHITFGTYATRLHGDHRPTVDRIHNQEGQHFIGSDSNRAAKERDQLKGSPILFTAPQRAVIESILPVICDRGQWQYRLAAAPVEGDHVHVLLDAKCSITPMAQALVR